MYTYDFSSFVVQIDNPTKNNAATVRLNSDLKDIQTRPSDLRIQWK